MEQEREILAYRGFAIESDGRTQGLMQVKTTEVCRLPSQRGKPLVYVDDLETAPWNQRELVERPRFGGNVDQNDGDQRAVTAHQSMPRDADVPVFVARRSSTEGRHPARTPVTHSYAALAFYTGGLARMEQRGWWTLEPGDVLIVPAGEPHRRVEAQRPEFWGLGFCVPCFAAHDAGRLLEPFERVRSGASAVVRIPAERHSFLEVLFQELEDASDPQRRGEPHAVQRSLLTLILNEVRRAARWDAEAASPKSVVAESLNFIERNCLRPLTLQDVARAVGRSPAYVTTALSRATGRSAVEWIIAGRMAEARRLLLHSEERIDEVAERVGYADPTHFIRMFQRAHGATPAAWRTAKSLSRSLSR